MRSLCCHYIVFRWCDGHRAGGVMTDTDELLAEMARRNKELATGDLADYLKAWRGFTALAHKADSLTRKDKELIAVGISLAKRCERCIAYHVRAALNEGATAREILEASFVGVMMEGGPALAHIGLVMDAVETYGK
jgi:AhpD family alkylhydroperoxidase